MPKLCWLLCIFSLSLTKSDSRKLNPNTATFEELIAIPVLDEGDALLIITLRDIEPYKSIEDFAERTEIDSTKIDYLKEIFVFEYKGIHRGFYTLSFRKSTKRTISTLAAEPFTFSLSKYLGATNFYLKYKEFTIGQFNLTIPNNNVWAYPTLYGSDYFLYITKPIPIAVGKDNFFTGLGLQLRFFDIFLTSEFKKNDRNSLQGGLNVKHTPFSADVSWSFTDKMGRGNLIYSAGKTFYHLNWHLKENQLTASYNFSRKVSAKTGISIRFSNLKNKYVYFQLNKKLNKETGLCIKSRFAGPITEVYEIRLENKNLSVGYNLLSKETISIRVAPGESYLKFSLYPGKKRYDVTTTLFFNVRNKEIKIQAGKSYSGEIKFFIRLGAID